MKTFKIIALVTIVFAMVSCNDEFLDRSPSDQISSTNFFKQGKDIEVALNAVYDIMAFNSWGNYGGGTAMLRIEAATDNAIDHHSWNEIYRVADGTATPSDEYVNTRWVNRYSGIQRANRILEGASGVSDLEESYKKRLLAETTFLRAYFYFDLVYLFGDVPYLKNSVTPSETQGSVANGPTETAKRTDKNIILSDLVTQLDAIQANLPISYPDSDKGRVTKGAALFLKAKILLLQEKWTEAAAAANQVMGLNAYQLFPTYETMFDYDGIGNSEVILDYQVKQKVDQGEFYIANYGSNSIGGWSSSCPLQSLVDAYECTDGKPITESTVFNASKPYDNRDPRLKYSILYPGHDWRGGVYNSIPGATYTKSIITGDVLGDGTPGEWNKSATGYNWLKYISNKDIDNSDYWDGGIHLILMRYAEVLLTYAEAKIEANAIDQSVYDAINAVRARADVNMPAIPTGLNQNELRERVRNERRVEFAFEGLRLFDIRRWKIADKVMPGIPKGLTYTDQNGKAVTLSWSKRVFTTPKDYLWPIPQTEIDISHITQNPGW